MLMFGETLNVLVNTAGNENDVCQSASVLNVRAKTRSDVTPGFSGSTSWMIVGELFSRSAMLNEFCQLNPNILIGVLNDSRVSR
jgi:hypothetical protein